MLSIAWARAHFQMHFSALFAILCVNEIEDLLVTTRTKCSLHITLTAPVHRSIHRIYHVADIWSDRQ